jgi:2-polyprenyl-3-methyl-5-hydroxy-6-metoxy-1,4-benzoquinol methylase
MMECERAWTCAGMTAGATLTDFGAGTGRATAWFRDRGLNVLAVDHVDNALEVSVPMVVQCLWSMDDAVPVADFGFCCDVMEHIPPEKVAAVLQGIRARVRVGCWFRIATRIDQMGRLIGQPLHLTVRGGEWWRRMVEPHFATVDVIHKDDRDVILWARA